MFEDAFEDPKCTSKVVIVPLKLDETVKINPRFDSNVIGYEESGRSLSLFEIYSVKEVAERRHVGNLTDENEFLWNQDYNKQRDLILQDLPLSIAYKNYRPYISISRKTGKSGFVYDILQAMREKFGLKLRFRKSFDNQFGTLVNGTWNGLVKMVLDNDVDMAATGLAVTPDRSTGSYEARACKQHFYSFISFQLLTSRFQYLTSSSREL